MNTRRFHAYCLNVFKSKYLESSEENLEVCADQMCLSCNGNVKAHFLQWT